MFKKDNDVENPILFILIGVLLCIGVIFIIVAVLSSVMNNRSDVTYSDTAVSMTSDSAVPVFTSSVDTFAPLSSIATSESNFVSNALIELPKISKHDLSDILFDSMSNMDTDIFLNCDVSSDDISDVVDVFYHRNLDTFWIMDTWFGEFSPDGVFIKFLFVDDMPLIDIKSMKKSFDSKVFDIIESANEFSSDYDKVKFVHDYLICNTEYCNTANENSLAHTAYGCLIEKQAVCDGYSKAFALIMQKLDIESGIVFGTSDEALGNMDHAWNYVYLDGAYRWVDITWDDVVSSSGRNVSPYKYFLLTDDHFFRTHKVIDSAYNDFVPVCK